MAGRTAILIINGLDRRGRYGAPLSETDARERDWIGLCLDQIERHSGFADHEVMVFDNIELPEQQERILAHRRVRLFPAAGRELEHAQGLDFLVEQTSPEIEYLITLDTDSFPVRDGWLEYLTGKLDEGFAVAGVWRDEMAAVLPPYIHPSCLAIRRSDLLSLDVSFSRGVERDVGANITHNFLKSGRDIWRLRRSNVRHLHFLLGGIYGDLIYHQGSGSRSPKFWMESDEVEDERVRAALQQLAFDDIDRLLAILRGEMDDVAGEMV